MVLILILHSLSIFNDLIKIHKMLYTVMHMQWLYFEQNWILIQKQHQNTQRKDFPPKNKTDAIGMVYNENGKLFIDQRMQQNLDWFWFFFSVSDCFSSLFYRLFEKLAFAFVFSTRTKYFFSLRWKWNEKCCGERRRDDWTENRGEIMKKGLGGQRRLYSKSFGKWQQTHSKCKNASLKNDVWCR